LSYNGPSETKPSSASLTLLTFKLNYE
jgi:hypothetical protein